MELVKPKVELINAPDYYALINTIELAGRTCYKSENRITHGSAEKFVKGIIQRGHEAVLEHSSITVKFTCDRGVSHEIVRHRLAAYCQESTRYCNYRLKDGNGANIFVVEPSTVCKGTEAYSAWFCACLAAERAYFEMLNWGCTPQEARSVLPNSLKTELVMTANVREWRHFLKQRCDVAAHPDIRVLARMLLKVFQEKYPVLFEDIRYDD